MPAITLELAGGYPAEAGVESYIRRVKVFPVEKTLRFALRPMQQI